VIVVTPIGDIQQHRNLFCPLGGGFVNDEKIRRDTLAVVK